MYIYIYVYKYIYIYIVYIYIDISFVLSAENNVLGVLCVRIREHLLQNCGKSIKATQKMIQDIVWSNNILIQKSGRKGLVRK